MMRGTTSTKFQFTLPRGERLFRCRLSWLNLKVSIHAPARGATRRQALILLSPYRFNSRSREGSDLHVSAIEPLIKCFNSRSREGSDGESRGV